MAGKLCRNQQPVQDANGRTRRGPAPVEEQDTLCPDCLHWGKRCLGMMEWDYRRLERAIGERRIVQSDKITGTKARPTPLNLANEALMVAITDVADIIGGIVADLIQVDQKWCGRGSLAHDYLVIHRAGRLASMNFDRLVDWGRDEKQPINLWGPRGYDLEVPGDGRVLREVSGPDLVLMVVRLHAEVTSELGLSKQRTRLPMPCPRCSTFTLHREIADDQEHTVYIKCIACSGQWGEAEYEWLGNMLIYEQNSMLKWLAAEAQWERDLLRKQLDRVATLVELVEQDPDVKSYTGEVFAQCLKEILDPEGVAAQ